MPYVDGWLADVGVRLHAVLPPVAVDGTCLSLRVLRPATHDLAALRALGTVDHLGDALLRAALDARLAFLVSGGTGTGKTTILSALLGVVGPQSASSPSKTWPSFDHVIHMSSGWCHGLPTSRERVASSCETSFGKRCGCGPIDWSSARSAAPRYAICSRR